MANYLMKNGLIPISVNGTDYKFVKSGELIGYFEKAPFYLKIVERVCKNG
jgi:hypothetical protein